jgi:Arc/MetJ family transcription regulator
MRHLRLTQDSRYPNIRIMKTTIDIPEDILKETMEFTGSKTIRGAVVAALEWYNRREKQRELVKHLGTFKNFMTQRELQEMRGTREKRHDHRRQQLVDRSVAAPRHSRSQKAGRKSA